MTCHNVQDCFPFWGSTVHIIKRKCLRVQYLPHHQPSHYERVENSEETINRCWVKTRQRETEVHKVTTDTRLESLTFQRRKWTLCCRIYTLTYSMFGAKHIVHRKEICQNWLFFLISFLYDTLTLTQKYYDAYTCLWTQCFLCQKMLLL